MTFPNFISILRLFLVPAIIYSLLSDFWLFACILFLIASLSDGVDGFIARHYNQGSELGAYLDPLADKALLSGVFLVLGYTGGLPLWLVIAVVSRDILIITGVFFSAVIGNPVQMKPLMVSKLTTVMQISLAAFVILEKASSSHFSFVNSFLISASGILTILSALVYLFFWMRHMTTRGIR